MNAKIKQLIKNELRFLSLKYKLRNIAKKRCYVAPATFKCEICGIFIYEGSKSECPLIGPKGTIRGKIEMDHILKIVPIDGFHSGILITGKTDYLWDWNIVLSRMFPDTSEEFQGLCKNCHLNKTNKEN